MGICNKFSVLLLSLIYAGLSAGFIFLQSRYGSTFIPELIFPAVGCILLALLGLYSIGKPGQFSRFLFTFVAMLTALTFLVGGLIIIGKRNDIRKDIVEKGENQCQIKDFDSLYSAAYDKFQGCPPSRDSYVECLNNKEVTATRRDLTRARLMDDLQRAINCGAPCTIDARPLHKENGSELAEKPACLSVISENLSRWIVITGGMLSFLGLFMFLLSISGCKESRRKRPVVVDDRRGGRFGIDQNA